MRRRTLLPVAALATLALAVTPISAQDIAIYPGPDEEWNYLYDFGDVEVGSSGVMIFQIGCHVDSSLDLALSNVFMGAGSSFAITNAPAFPLDLRPGESIYVEVVFGPGAEGFFEGVMKIISDAIYPPGGDIDYNLRGMGIAFEPPPEEMMQGVLDFYAAGIADGTIYGVGSGGAPASHIRVFGNMLDAADDLIAAGDFAGACQQLDHAVAKSDGLPQPPDFLEGSGVSALNAMLLDVMNALGC
jgi:hypothetical protein